MQVTLFPGNNLSQLLDYQRHQIPRVGMYDKLGLEDLLRVAEGLNGNIFNNNGACVGFRESLLTGKPAQFSFEGHKVPLNRLLYHNFIGDVSDADVVENSCVNKSTCCNIRHITKTSRQPSRQTSKLSDEQVIDICHRLAKNESASQIAKDYGVSRVCIHKIKTGKTHRAISTQILQSKYT